MNTIKIVIVAALFALGNPAVADENKNRDIFSQVLPEYNQKQVTILLRNQNFVPFCADRYYLLESMIETETKIVGYSKSDRGVILSKSEKMQALFVSRAMEKNRGCVLHKFSFSK